MNVSRARFTHSRQNGTLAESRSEEGSLTGSLAQPDTWRIPHSSLRSSLAHMIVR